MKKYITFIVSGGRTGTTFLGALLAKMVQDSFSIHEPDLFEGLNRKTWERVKLFGPYHMLWGRVLGLTGIRNLSQRYQAGKLPLKTVCKRVQDQRCSYYASIRKDLIVESYYQWYGILPAIPKAFQHYKVLGVVRDPRDWVCSWMNFKAHFGKKDWVTRIGFRRLDPIMVGDEHCNFSITLGIAQNV